MIDFILAGILYLGIMFIVSFCLSFVTIGITYSVTACFGRYVIRFRQPDLAFK
jgi:hypothetical protein